MNRLQINNFNFSTDNEDIYIDSETVAKGFNIEHRSLTRSLEANFAKCDLKSHFIKNANNVNKKTYLLTERQIMILPAITKPTSKTIAFQTALVDAFLEARKQLTKPRVKSPDEYAMELANQVQRLYGEKKQLEKKIETDQPKVEFAEKLVKTKDVLTFTEFAKVLEAPIMQFCGWMKDNFCYNSRNGVVPREKYVKPRQYLATSEYEYDRKNGKFKIRTLITGLGQAYFRKKWMEHIQGELYE